MLVGDHPEFGKFSSIICLKAVIVRVEETLGSKATEVASSAAGRADGKKLAQDLKIVGLAEDLSALGAKMAQALGKNGTRPRKIEQIA